MHNEGKGRKSSLIVIVMLLVLISVGFSNFSGVPQIQAQTSSSCDRDVISLVECSPSTSSSSPASEVEDDSDEKDSNDDDIDEGDNGEEQEEEQKNGDIESKIPSTAGVPFP